MQAENSQKVSLFTNSDYQTLADNSHPLMRQILREFHHRISSAHGDELFFSPLKDLAVLSDADYIFICKFCNECKTRVRTIAVYANGKICENFEFDLNNTPCENVVKEGPFCYLSGVQSKFPLDELSVELGIDSYIGIPIVDSTGEVLGPIAILGREPLRNNVFAELLLQSYALRVSAELESRNNKKALDLQKDRQQAILDAIPQPIFLKSPSGHYTDCNKEFQQQLGISKAQLVGKTVFELSPKRAKKCHGEDITVFQTKSLREYEELVDYADGTRRDVVFSKAPILSTDGSIDGLVGTIRDISPNKRADETINTLIKSIVGLDGDICFDNVLKELSRWLDAEYAFVAEVISATKIKIIAMHSDSILLKDYILPFKGTPCGSVIEEHFHYYPRQVQDVFPDDDFLVQLDAQSYIGVPLYGEDGTILGTMCVLSRYELNLPRRTRELMEILAVKVAAEIDRRHTKVTLQKNKEHINYIAKYHQITGLPNIVLFQDRLQQMVTNGTTDSNQIALLHLGVDRLKKISNCLGRHVGDQVLQKVAQRLLKCVGKKGSVSHLTGNEFGIILEGNIDVNNVVSLIQKIQTTLVNSIQIDDETLYVSTSIGICLYPDDGHDMPSLLNCADSALSRAKENGGGTYQFYTTEMNERAHELLLLENNLRNALEYNEFILNYQPQFDLNTNAIIGVEALVRWNHPQLGLVPPNDFIPLAEETGLIIKIGEWVLHTACLQNKQWQQCGYPCFPIAVNISARQFSQDNLVKHIEKVLKVTGLEPQFLELEITESLIMQDIDASIRTMNQLKELGLSLSIDDFGTGYSSLSYLKRFPIEKLKIDKSFIKDVIQQGNDAAITTSIIALAQNMNLKTIAEGIETEEQLQFLRQAGCEEGQGFYLGRPKLAMEIQQLLTELTPLN